MQISTYNSDLIKQEIEKIRLCRHQMLIIVGKRRIEVIEQFAQEIGVEPINLNLHLSELLLELPVSQRGRKVGELVNRLFTSVGDPIILNYIELLFLPELQIDPIRLFEDASRNKVLIIEWAGKYENGTLTYASPEHPEYRVYHGLETYVKIVN